MGLDNEVDYSQLIDARLKAHTHIALDLDDGLLDRPNSRLLTGLYCLS